MSESNLSISTTTNIVDDLTSKFNTIRDLNNEVDVKKGMLILECAEIAKNDPQMQESIIDFLKNYDDILNHNDFNDAKQLIKIKGIEGFYDLGLKKLKKIRGCTGHNYNTIDLNVGNARFGDIHDNINLESYLICLKFSRAGIYNVPDNKIKEYVMHGLEDRYLTKNKIEAIKNSGNYHSTITRIIYGGIRDDKKNSGRKRYGNNELLKIYTNLVEIYKSNEELAKAIIERLHKKYSEEQIRSIFNDMNKKVYLGLDRAIIEDMILLLQKMFNLELFFSKGDYPYGTKYPSDDDIYDSIIDELLNEMEGKS